MKKFKVGEKEFNMPTDWNDLTLKHYVDLTALEETKSEYILGELYLLKVIETLCGAENGDLDDLTLDMVTELSNDANFLQIQPEFSNTKNIKIGDVDYAFPHDFNKLTMGEYISIKTLQEGQTSHAKSLPYLLAVILRPAKLVKDNETGIETWVQDKFDANNIEWRKELFLNEPVFKLLGPITFFLNGNGSFMTNTEDSMVEDKK